MSIMIAGELTLLQRVAALCVAAWRSQSSETSYHSSLFSIQQQLLIFLMDFFLVFYSCLLGPLPENVLD